MNRNKLVLSYCPNFYKIINFEFFEGDHVTQRLISIYEDYIFNVNVNDTEELKKVEELDKVLNKYIEDYIFRKEMKNELMQIRVRKDEPNLLDVIVRNIISIFENYMEGRTSNIYLSKWI